MDLTLKTPQTNTQYRQTKQAQNFTGLIDAATAGLRFFDTNQAIGANCVDLCAMVIPRTTVDFINRGPDAGAETARRESMGTINHSSVGLYGTLAGFAVAAGFNNHYGIKAHKIFADTQTLNTIAQSWHDVQHSAIDDPLKQHVTNFIDNIKVFNTDVDKVNGYVSIPEADKRAIIDTLYNKLKNSPDQTINKDFANSLHAMITAATGGEKNVVLVAKDGKEAPNSLKTLISNFYNLTKAFSTEKAVETFKNSTDIASNDLVKLLKSMNLKRSIGGLGVATAIGMATQPVNMYLTKKKTGSDGFVGVEGRSKDNSTEFKIMKTLASLAFAAMALSTITLNPKKFLSKIQFQGMLPTIDQLKLVYGLTISSRIISARDKDEMRESLVKDTLGFMNLLVLGSLVTKYTARAFDKTLINETATKGKNWFAKITDSSLKTRDEVLLPMLKKNGIDIVKDGKPLSFTKLMQSISKLNAEDKKVINKKLMALNFAQIVGYIYSGVILGVGIPKLNIYMTNKSEAKRKAKLAQAKAQEGNKQDAVLNKQTNGLNSQPALMLAPENISFLKNKFDSANLK